MKIQLEENTDDMWNLYNLIAKGDIVKGQVLRKVTKENVTGMVDSKKKKIMAMI